MRSWLRIGIVATGALVLLFGPLLAAPASAQVSERFRVMVTNLMPLNDANDDFGKDLAKELRDLINQFGTHQPIDEREIRDAADRFDLDMEDLDCVRSQQLAGQINANVVFCGTYTEDKDADTFSLQGIQFAAPGGLTFMIEDKTWHKDDHEVAAQEIAGAFETYVDQLRTAQFCGDYYQSKDWEGADRTCTAALEMNPDNSQVRFVYANVLFQTERLEESYRETLQVIEADPLHEGALQLAGYVAASLELNDEAREHYSAYLALNPGDAIIRMQIAYDLAQAGDVEGAMLMTEEGLAIEPDNVELLLRHAAFATRAAQDITARAEPGAPLSAEVAELYRKAMGSYEVVYEVQGDEMEVGHILNMIAGFTELEQLQDAIDMAARALETHGDDASLWSRYADVLKRAERVEEAIAALNEVEARDPGFANVKARQGSWLLETGQEDDALGFLLEAVEKGEQTADAMAVLLLANAHSKGVVPKDWGHALRVIGLAKSFENEVAEGTRGQLDFWHGFSLFNQALEQERPQTLETAQLTLPKFQQAARFFVLPRVAAYAEANAIGLQQFRDATQQYIEIQEAIIQRGR
ncbi:MAG: tetratricopeptide repeat protein [Gemmatimonadota bacterium]|nr:tetratricopeptide repeat protein [Gemmatimonadota bacterium]